MKFLATLEESLKSERKPDESDKFVIKVPQLEIPKWLENLKFERESQFKKVPDTKLHKLPSEGFFFSYVADENNYFESNCSFSFIVGVTPRKKSSKSRWKYAPHAGKLSKYSHEKYYHIGLNFVVNKETRKIELEKKWSGSKIAPARISNPEEVRDAIKAAVHHNSELSNYTFVPVKKKVSEYVKKGAAGLESGGASIVYFAALGAEMKEILKNGIKESSPSSQYDKSITFFFDKKDAGDLYKSYSSWNRLYHVVAMAKIEFSDPNLFNKEYSSFHLAKGKVIASKDIELIKTNMEAYFKDDFTPVKILDKIKKTPLLKSQREWDFIFTARNDEEFEYFKKQFTPEKRTKAGKSKTGRTVWVYGANNWEESNPLGLKLRHGPTILMFRPGATKKDINMHFAQQWLEVRNIYRYAGYKKRKELSKESWGYKIYFEKKFPQFIKYELVPAAFEERGRWNDPLTDLMDALGIEVKKDDN